MRRLVVITLILAAALQACSSSSSGPADPTSGSAAEKRQDVAGSDTTNLGSTGDLAMPQPGEVGDPVATAVVEDNGVVPVDALPSGAQTFEFEIDSFPYRCERRASSDTQARCRATSASGPAIMYCSDQASSSSCSAAWYPDEFAGYVLRTIEGSQYLCVYRGAQWACSLYEGGDPAKTELIPRLFCTAQASTFVCDPAGSVPVPGPSEPVLDPVVPRSVPAMTQDAVPVEVLSIQGGRYLCETYQDGTRGCYPDDGSGLLVGDPAFICWPDLVCESTP